MREQRPGNPSSGMVRQRTWIRSSSEIDIANHLAQRRAAKALRKPQRVVVSIQRFGPKGFSARVLVDGQLYEVDEIQLRQLRSGLTPTDLLLDPVMYEGD